MKKILLSLSLIVILGGFVSIASASTTSCKNVEFSNGVTACVKIEKNTSNAWTLSTSLNGGSTSNLRCDIMTPDSALKSVSVCNGTFYYNERNLGRVKLWIRYSDDAPRTWEGKPNSDNERTYPQWMYNFSNEGREDDNLTNNTSNNSSNSSLNNLYLSTSTTTPSSNQYVDLTVRARDRNNYTINNFRDTVNFKVYYRSSSSSSWTQTNSSSYYTMDSNYNNGYTFSSYNNGQKTFNNFIKFNTNNYEYKVRVYAENNSSIYNEVTFNVGSSSNNNSSNNSSNSSLNNLYLNTSTTRPSSNQYVDLTVRARDRNNYTINNFRDTVNFKVYYRSSSSSSWTQTNSSSYYTMDSNYNNGYTFSSYNNGQKTFNNFIKFNTNNYEYKVRVYAENNSSIYNEVTFNVGSSSNNNSSNVYGFSSNELETVKGMYSKRDTMIRNLENAYPRLRNNSRRETMSNDLKKAMQEIIDNKSYKTYNNFSDFNNAWIAWYRYTTSTR